jgi:hypothetical protein
MASPKLKNRYHIATASAYAARSRSTPTNATVSANTVLRGR